MRQLTYQPDDLVTSWAQYKAFASHAEKFNMTPTDIAGPGTDEPVKVHHDGGGTHGAGGGGSGGGAVGLEGTKGETEESTKSDVVDGKPKNTLHVPRSASHSHSHTRSGSSGSTEGKSRASSPAPGSTTGPSSATSTGQGQASGSKPVDVQTGHANAHGGEEGDRKGTGPNEAFADWEREEMEELLGELRGHLGESGSGVIRIRRLNRAVGL